MSNQDRDLTQLKATELRDLLSRAGESPLLRDQLQQLVDETEAELADGRTTVLFEAVLPRVALFLKGSSVKGQSAIRSVLAGEALVLYEKMYTQQALHEERQVARAEGRHRRRRGTPAPELWFTGTPRGSFGLEFTPKETEDGGLTELHSKALLKVTDAIADISESTVQVDKFTHDLSPNVIAPMRRFFTVLEENSAELRVATTEGRSRIVSAEQVRSAAERLKKVLEEEIVDIYGIFRGLTRESYFFDIVDDAGYLISGSISDQLSEDDLDRIDALTNTRCKAEVRKSTIRFPGDTERQSYVLLNAIPW